MRDQTRESSVPIRMQSDVINHLVDEGRGECELRLESQEDALHFEQSGPAILGRRNQGSSVAIESQS